MRKFGIILIVILISSPVFAQFKIGVQGSFDNTWLINRNLSDAGDSVDPLATFTYGYGAQFVYVFNESFGISTGFGIQNYNQKTDGTFGGGVFSYEAETKLSALNIPLLMRLENAGGTYFEVGPTFSFVSSAKETYSQQGGIVIVDPNYTDRSFDDDFSTLNIFGTVGFGVLVDLSDNMQMTAGLNLSYGFTDATEEYSTEADLDAADASLYSNVAHETQTDGFGYESTAAASAGVKIGVVYVIRGTGE
ncbi:MAG: outer membrane beta-barrel protein [Flavobacteriales bacterium]|nr:outer membrane beta-barrel protein [Flavobacteriales bacterium]